MPIITIAHQVGSGGREVGQRVAALLGMPYVNREIVQGIAQKLGISEKEAEHLDEKAEPLISQLSTLFRYNVSGPLSRATSTSVSTTIDSITYQEATKAVLETMSTSGNAVIAGHGANFYLAGRSNILSVFIYAPQANRIATIMQRDTINHNEAARQVHQNDIARANYIRMFYGADWRDPNEYHIMINTAIYPPELAADLIIQAARHSLDVKPLPTPIINKMSKIDVEAAIQIQSLPDSDAYAS